MEGLNGYGEKGTLSLLSDLTLEAFILLQEG